MKQPGMELYYQYLLSKDGEIYKKSRRRVAHSFVTGFTKMLYNMFGANITAIIDAGNTSRDCLMNYNYPSISAGAGTSTYGLVVGTGTNVINVSNYALQTQIAHGAGASQLQYSACTTAAPDFTSSVGELTITRLFTNASGGTITVQEIGIYLLTNVGGSRYICIARDLATIEIVNGATLTLNYVIQTTL